MPHACAMTTYQPFDWLVVGLFVFALLNQLASFWAACPWQAEEVAQYWLEDGCWYWRWDGELWIWEEVRCVLLFFLFQNLRLEASIFDGWGFKFRGLRLEASKLEAWGFTIWRLRVEASKLEASKFEAWGFKFRGLRLEASKLEAWGFKIWGLRLQNLRVEAWGLKTWCLRLQILTVEASNLEDWGLRLQNLRLEASKFDGWGFKFRGLRLEASKLEAWGFKIWRLTLEKWFSFLLRRCLPVKTNKFNFPKRIKKRNRTFPARHARGLFGVGGPATEEHSVTDAGEPGLEARPDKRFSKTLKKQIQGNYISEPRFTNRPVHTQNIL